MEEEKAEEKPTVVWASPPRDPPRVFTVVGSTVAKRKTTTTRKTRRRRRSQSRSRRRSRPAATRLRSTRHRNVPPSRADSSIIAAWIPIPRVWTLEGRLPRRLRRRPSPRRFVRFPISTACAKRRRWGPNARWSDPRARRDDFEVSRARARARAAPGGDNLARGLRRASGNVRTPVRIPIPAATTTTTCGSSRLWKNSSRRRRTTPRQRRTRTRTRTRDAEPSRRGRTSPL